MYDTVSIKCFAHESPVSYDMYTCMYVACVCECVFVSTFIAKDSECTTVDSVSGSTGRNKCLLLLQTGEATDF